MRMSRRMGIHNAGGAKKPKDLKELFSNMTIDEIAFGRASSSLGAPAKYMYTPTSAARYFFAFDYNYWGVYKLVQDELTNLFTSYSGGVILSLTTPGTITHKNTYSTVVGIASLAEDYDIDAVDEMLSSFTAGSHQYRGSSEGNISIPNPNVDKNPYVVPAVTTAAKRGFTIYNFSDTNSPLLSTPVRVYVRKSGTTYYVSTNGTSNASVRGSMSTFSSTFG